MDVKVWSVVILTVLACLVRLPEVDGTGTCGKKLVKSVSEMWLADEVGKGCKKPSAVESVLAEMCCSKA